MALTYLLMTMILTSVQRGVKMPKNKLSDKVTEKIGNTIGDSIGEIRDGVRQSEDGIKIWIADSEGNLIGFNADSFNTITKEYAKPYHLKDLERILENFISSLNCELWFKTIHSLRKKHTLMFAGYQKFVSREAEVVYSIVKAKDKFILVKVKEKDIDEIAEVIKKDLEKIKDGKVTTTVTMVR